MSAPTSPSGRPLDRSFAGPLPEHASPPLDAAALAELAPFGEERAVEVGDVLFRAGDDSYDFLVVLEGEVDIVRPDVEGERWSPRTSPGASSAS